MTTLKMYRPGKTEASSMMGLILSLLTINASVFGINPWLLSFIVFAVTTVSSFLPSTVDWDGNWYRPLMKGSNLLMLIGSIVGYLLDNPIVKHLPDGTIQMVTWIPIAYMQAAVNTINVLLAWKEQSKAKSVPDYKKRVA